MPDDERRCQHCQARGALRRYCRTCSPQASAFYKRAARQAAKAAGEPYWLDWWVKKYGDRAPIKRREYQRHYMQEHRRNKTKEAT